MLKTLQVQGKDGRTAQQRARGNTGLQKRLNFGEEVCRYKARAEEGVIDQSTWRWSTGIWLGIERRTERFVLLDGTKGGIWHPRILLMPEIEKWDVGAIKCVNATPRPMHDLTVPGVARLEKPEVDIARKGKMAAVRRLYIKHKCMDAHGHSPNCLKC